MEDYSWSRSNREAGNRAWCSLFEALRWWGKRESKRHAKRFFLFSVFVFARTQFSGADYPGARDLAREKQDKILGLRFQPRSRPFVWLLVRSTLIRENTDGFAIPIPAFTFVTNWYSLGVWRHVWYHRFQNDDRKSGRCRRRCSKWRYSPGLCLENSRCGIYVWSCGYSGYLGIKYIGMRNEQAVSVSLPSGRVQNLDPPFGPPSELPFGSPFGPPSGPPFGPPFGPHPDPHLDSHLEPPKSRV